jgi:hypothetical protein
LWLHLRIAEFEDQEHGGLSEGRNKEMNDERKEWFTSLSDNQ